MGNKQAVKIEVVGVTIDKAMRERLDNGESMLFSTEHEGLLQERDTHYDEVILTPYVIPDPIDNGVDIEINVDEEVKVFTPAEVIALQERERAQDKELKKEDKNLETFGDMIRDDLKALPTEAGKEIMRELLISSKVDYKLTLVALLRMIREGYDVFASKIDRGRFDEIAKKPMHISEVDWYAYDMHTFPGRVAKDLVARSRRVDKGQFGWMWWFGEASIRIPEDIPLDDFKPYYMTEREKRGIENWKKVREDVIAKVKYVVKDLFKIETKL